MSEIRDKVFFAVREFRSGLEHAKNFYETNPSNASSQNLWLFNLLDKIPGVKLADVPPLEFKDGVDEHTAILNALNANYTDVREQPFFHNLDSFHLKIQLENYGFQRSKVLVSKIEATNRFGERNAYVAVSGSLNENCGIWMLFPDNFPSDRWPSMELFGQQYEVTNPISGTQKEKLKYLTGPENIILTNGKDRAVSLYPFMQGKAFKIVGSDDYNAVVHRKTQNDNYNFYLWSDDVFMSRLLNLGDNKDLLVETMPLFIFAHELGHSLQSIDGPALERERNATYFAVRLARKLHEKGIDIISPANWKQVIRESEHMLKIYMDPDKGDKRISRIEKVFTSE